jgi:hypothetical protein
MSLKKRVKVSAITLLIVFAELTAPASKIFPARAQAAERQTEQQAKCLKTVAASVVDSTGDYKYAILWDGSAKIVRYLKEEGTVKIPAALDGHPVTAIGERAFFFKDSITGIEIPDTVTDIGSESFYGTGIKEVTIPEAVVRIGDRAFGYCLNLERLFIPQNVREIEGNIVEISDNLKEIEVDSRNAAYKSVDGVLYNKDVTELLAMPGGKDITGFRFPESVERIGRFAFYFCEHASFTELVIPDRVTTIEFAAFKGCRNLKKVVMGENVTVIGGNAFSGCSSLCEVILNEKLKVIDKDAFYDCDSIIKIDIPDGVTEIGEWAFGNCNSLKNITVPKSVAKIGRYALAYFEDRTPYEDVCITGYTDTAAHRYAKKYCVAFQNVETGKAIRYDWIPVPKGKIKKLTAGAKKIKLACQSVEGASYRVAVKKAGAAGWKKYDMPKASAVIKGLASGKQYKVKVRALRKIEGKYYYGNWSNVKKIKVR